MRDGTLRARSPDGAGGPSRPTRLRALPATALGCALAASSCLFGSSKVQPSAVQSLGAATASTAPLPPGSSEPATPAALGTAAQPPAPAAAQARRRVLRRIDEKGVTHYVIEFPDGDSNSAPAPAPDGPAFSAVAAAPRPAAAAPAPVAEAAPPSVDAREDALPSLSFGAVAGRGDGFTAAADVQGTAAAMRELESQIARDRETLKQIISESGPAGPDLEVDPRLREIAERLPRLQAELEALRSETKP